MSDGWTLVAWLAALAMFTATMQLFRLVRVPRLLDAILHELERQRSPELAARVEAEERERAERAAAQQKKDEKSIVVAIFVLGAGLAALVFFALR